MLNYGLLRSEMAFYNVSKQKMAKQMGLSRSALYRKLNGTSDFSRDDICKLKKILCLSDEKLMDIFFKE